MTNVRARNEGSLFRRNRDGRWVATVLMPNGRRRSRSTASKSEGAKALAELIRQRDAAIPADPSLLRLGPYLEKWLGDVRPRLAPATWRKHESIVRVHVIPRLGHVRLSELRVTHCRDLMAGLSRHMDAQSVRHVRSTLRRGLADAVRDGLVVRNVAALAEPPPMDKAERRILSAEDVRLVTEEARDEPYWPLWVVIANTGLRVSEALGLAWSDVDLQRREVRVRVQLARQDGTWVRRPLKTRKSKRTVPLTEDAIDALRVQRERQIVAQEVRPIDGLVFTTPTGYPIHSTNILPDWYRTLSRLGLPKVTTHDLRHSAATIMFRQGVPIEAIADILGHSTTRVTADLYRHRVPEVQRSAIDLLAKAIRG